MSPSASISRVSPARKTSPHPIAGAPAASEGMLLPSKDVREDGNGPITMNNQNSQTKQSSASILAAIESGVLTTVAQWAIGADVINSPLDDKVCHMCRSELLSE